MAASKNKLFTEGDSDIGSPDGVLATCRRGITEHVVPGQTLVVGLSGGRDSITLLHCLLRIRNTATTAAFHLKALHVHHALSDNADRWEEFCRRTCANWQVSISVERVSVEANSPDGLEGAARRARHGAFARSKADWIVLAHNRGDQAETLLFNLLRGAGLAGAAAMSPARHHLLRPLLGVSRTDITAYAHAQGLAWIEDESNADTRLSRNYLRHEVLAPLSGRFPAAEKNLAAAASRFDEAKYLLDTLARIDLGVNPGTFPVPIDVLAGLTEARGRNVLRYLLQHMGIGIPSEERLGEALRQLVDAGLDRHPRVRFGNWDILRRQGAVHVTPVG